MSREWKCKDCVCFETDACHCPSTQAEYVACEHLIVDHDYAYQQGREDAIDEVLLDINSRMTLVKMYADEDERKANTYDENYHKGGLWELGIMRDRLEQIKEQKNESNC